MTRDETLADLIAMAEPLRADPEKHEAELSELIAAINTIRGQQEREAREGIVMAVAPEVDKRGPGRPRKVQA